MNPKLEVIGYELAVHPHPGGDPYMLEDRRAVLRILEELANIGLDTLVGDQRAFVRVTPAVADSLPSPVLPANRSVLMVEKDALIEAAYGERLTGLIRAGYALGLDHVGAINDWVKAMTAYASVFKVDVHGASPVKLTEVINQLRVGRSKLIAAQVTTLDEFAFAQRLGCHYFQGRFYLQPRISQTRKVDASRIGVMRTLGLIQDPGSDFVKLGKVISLDSRLTAKLLGLVNSLAYDLPRPATSVEQAVAFMGLKQLRAWLSLLTMASIQDKPAELTNLAILRGRMCELIGREMGINPSEPLFTVGLFSVIDALLDMPIAEAIQDIPLSSEVVDAILKRAGAAGAALRLVEAYENTAWDQVEAFGLRPSVITASFLSAVRWATQFSSTMS
jgi:EAL and modified HD-GYP domain-containing signal transduction protein